MRSIEQSPLPAARRLAFAILFSVMLYLAVCLLSGCTASSGPSSSSVDAAPSQNAPAASVQSSAASAGVSDSQDSSDDGGWENIDVPMSVADISQDSSSASSSASDAKQRAKELYAKLDIEKDFREGFAHGKKGAKYQKYIVLHDTEGDGDASGVVDYWDGNGSGVAAHFIVNKDGSIVQCVKLDQIAHHAGYGDTGHNEEYDVEDESRDDKEGTVELGPDFADYGMNSYSIGIEMVHVGGSGDYPEEQLDAVDDLIAYIDAYYGKESEIIDHKMWRTGNSDTSEEFAEYLENYRDHRTHA